MNAAIIALIASIAVAVIGGAVTLTATVINVRIEKSKTSKATMDEIHRRELNVKDERLTLRDEQLADCHADKQVLERKVDFWKTRARELEKGA